MTTRAKFRCDSIEKNTGGGPIKFASKPDGSPDYEKPIEWAARYNVKMSPVYSSNPESENAKFWEASPGGQLSLNTIKDHGFKVGQAYYLDITEAD